MKKIFLLTTSILAIMLLISGCKKEEKITSGFKVVDGKEIYMEGKDQVIDKLVEVEGDTYYIGLNGQKIKNDWHEIDNDGNFGYFGAMGQMIKNQVKEIDGKYFIFNEDGKVEKNGLKIIDDNKYYASKDGYLLCNSLVTVDNQDYYFGSDGKAIKKTGWVVSEDGDMKGTYYLDEYGNHLTNTWYEDCYLDSDGHMLTNQWIDGYYVGSDGIYLKNTTTPDGKKLDSNGKVVVETTAAPKANYVQTTQNATSVNNSVSTTVVEEETEELYIKNVEKITDSYDYSWTSSVDNYDVDGCEILIEKPIIGGKNDEEVTILNNQISDIMEQLLEMIKDEDMLSRSYNAIYSYKLSNAKLKYTDNKATITFTESTKYTNDTAKTNNGSATYTFEYSRKNKNSNMVINSWTTQLKISTNQTFYAD